MVFFRKKKVEKETEEIASDNRQHGNGIVAELDVALLDVNRKYITDEDLVLYRRLISACKESVKEADTIGIDIQEIDMSTKNFIQRFARAVSEGNVDTANICLDAVYFGCVEARKIYVEKTEKEMMDIMKIRKEKMYVYDTIFRLSDNINQLKVELEDIKEQLERDAESFEIENKKAQEYCEAHKADEEKLIQVYATNAAVPVELLEMDAVQSGVITYYTTIKVENLQRALMEITMKNYMEQIKLISVELRKPEIVQSKEITQAVMNIRDNMQASLGKQMESLREMKEVTAGFDDIVEAALKNPSLKQHMMDTNTKYQKIQREMQRKLEQEEEVKQRLKQQKQEKIKEQANYNYN